MQKPARRRANTKALRRQAEVAAEHWMAKRLGCIAIRRAVRTQWQRVDFFGADLVGVLDTGAKIYIQVTTGSRSAMSTAICCAPDAATRNCSAWPGPEPVAFKKLPPKLCTKKRSWSRDTAPVSTPKTPTRPSWPAYS